MECVANRVDTLVGLWAGPLACVITAVAVARRVTGAPPDSTVGVASVVAEAATVAVMVGESDAVAVVVAVGESGLVVALGDVVGVTAGAVEPDEAACAAPTPRAGGRDERNKRAHRTR